MTSRAPETVRRSASGLESEFPGVTAWFGVATGAWWALVPLRGGSRLVEAHSPQELREAITQAATWPWPPGPGAR
jgi:hypothetical protein